MFLFGAERGEDVVALLVCQAAEIEFIVIAKELSPLRRWCGGLRFFIAFISGRLSPDASARTNAD